MFGHDCELLLFLHKGLCMKSTKKFRHEVYITDTETFEWYFIIFEVNEHNVPIHTLCIVKVQPLNSIFKIYPYLIN